MRIGLVGDTHIPEAGPDLPPEAYDALRGCERILHCGDLHSLEVVDRLSLIAPTVVSRGNGDTLEPRVRRPGVPEDQRVVDRAVFEVNGLVIGLTHDLEHTEHRNDEDALELLDRCFGQRVDIAVSGHTHVPSVRGLRDGTAVVNPGSPTMPYGYLGIAGTIGLLDLEDDCFTARVIDLATGDVQLSLTGPGFAPAAYGPRPRGGH